MARRTIEREVSLSGAGLHTGAVVTATFRPAPGGRRVVFRRTDPPGTPEIAARLAAAPRFLAEARSRYTRPVRFWVEACIRSCAGTAEYLEEVARDFPARLDGEVAPAAKERLGI